ncbi:hypothetical protein AB0B31_11030 [Catellatospora citrea]|uniref:hypothetical protein n=1 Tax=Catellatospora citrea TaxID=53366 RepID=UPI0033D52B4A
MKLSHLLDAPPPPTSLDPLHIHRGGEHTVLVCLPGKFRTPTDMLSELHTRLSLVTEDLPDLPLLICRRHILAPKSALTGNPGDRGVPMRTNSAPLGMIMNEAVVDIHTRRAADIYRRWKSVTAATPVARPAPRELAGLGKDAALNQAVDEFLQQPRIAAMIDHDPRLGTADSTLEPLGPGLQALQAGRQAYIDYAVGTIRFGHGLLTLDGTLLRSGNHVPAADRLDDRMAYLTYAADYLGRLHDTVTLVAVHVDLPILHS